MNKKSSSFFRLDEQVFFTLGAVCILSLIIMAFRFGTHTPCSPVKIDIKSTALIQGNIIRFKAGTQGGKKFEWNFGDSTVKEDAINITNHTYKRAGRYIVTVLVDGECSDMMDVVIGEAPRFINSDLQPVIVSSHTDTAYTGERVSFTDACTASTEWEWRFGEKSGVDATTRDASYTFTIPGRKLVTLKVNNNNAKSTSHVLFIIDRREIHDGPKPEPKPKLVPSIIIMKENPDVPPITPIVDPKKEEVKEKPKAPKASFEQLESMLMEVADGKKRAEDFSDYTCGQLGFNVTFEDDIMLFSTMCEKLKRTRRIKKIKVNAVFNDNNCIVTMTVSLKKRII